MRVLVSVMVVACAICGPSSSERSIGSKQEQDSVEAMRQLRGYARHGFLQWYSLECDSDASSGRPITRIDTREVDSRCKKIVDLAAIAYGEPFKDSFVHGMSTEIQLFSSELRCLGTDQTQRFYYSKSGEYVVELLVLYGATTRSLYAGVKLVGVRRVLAAPLDRK